MTRTDESTTAESTRGESGFTLIELMIASLIGVLVLITAGSILTSMLKAQNQVNDLTAAATAGQLVSRSVEEGVRNAAGPIGSTDPVQAVGIKAEPVTDTTTRSQLLRARVATGTENGTVTWQCEAWYYDGTTNTVSWATSSAEINSPGGFAWTDASHTGIAPITAQAGVNWIMLADNITLPADATQFFGSGNSQVRLNFEVSNAQVSLILIPNTVVQRKLAAEGTGPTQCYDS
ncbi:MAG: prepilin-type N-terminal cleavage/methylation domain-containing protein [Microbacteriaceae bacterium]|nr:MAG: prepilin-type N-terminal cleavage/methylation domain-containing protein [Microbacteriaceae bacterium]